MHVNRRQQGTLLLALSSGLQSVGMQALRAAVPAGGEAAL